jgi:hypothetical protein
MKFRPTWSDRLATPECSSRTAEFTAPAASTTVPADTRRVALSLRYSSVTIRPPAPGIRRVTRAPVSSVTFACSSARAIPTVSPSRLAPVVSGNASQGVAARFSQPARSIPSGSDDGVTPAALSRARTAAMSGSSGTGGNG